MFLFLINNGAYFSVISIIVKFSILYHILPVVFLQINAENAKQPQDD